MDAPLTYKPSNIPIEYVTILKYGLIYKNQNIVSFLGSYRAIFKSILNAAITKAVNSNQCLGIFDKYLINTGVKTYKTISVDIVQDAKFAHPHLGINVLRHRKESGVETPIDVLL